jgi:hypothetical protein
MLLILSAMFGAAAPAQEDAARIVERLEACRERREDGARLACYDAVVGPMAEARRAGRLIVLDRAKVVSERRRQFGLTSDDERATGVAEVRELAAKVREVGPAPTYGRVHIALDNGQVWESVGPMRRKPRVDQDVTVKAANFGAFRLQFDGGASQVKRVR